MPAGVINRKEFERTHSTCSTPHLTEYHLLAIGRHFNCNGQAAAIVASAAFSQRGRLIDWVAYWGSADPELSRDKVAQSVAANGMKMSQSDGEHFFPRLPGSYYR